MLWLVPVLVQSFKWTHKSDEHETQGMIRPEAHSSPAVNLWNQTLLVLPKYNGETSIGKAFAFPKRKNRKEERDGSSQVKYRTSKANDTLNLEGQDLPCLAQCSAFQAHKGGNITPPEQAAW